MNPNIEKDEMFKQLYKSAVKASYFGGMQDPGFAQKSKLQLNNAAEKSN